MKNLVFRICLVALLRWQLAASERSANGYFYDKPEGIAFEETPGSVQLLAAPDRHNSPPPPPTVDTFLQHLQPPPLSYAGGSNIQVIPATLVYEDTKHIDTELRPPQQLQDNVVSYIQPQLNYRNNLQPVEFTIREANGAPQPCGVQPIVAQLNPALVNLSGGGPLTRVITTCGPNNNCNSITVQSELKRHLGAFGQIGVPQQTYGVPQQPIAVPEARSAVSFDSNVLLVRPPRRRLVEYSEFESNDPYN